MSSRESYNHQPVYQEPSIRVVRRVRKLPDDYRERLFATVLELGIPRHDAVVFLKARGHLALIAANEVINIHRALGVEPTEEGMDRLEDYLDKNLPIELNERLPIDLKPLDQITEKAYDQSGCQSDRDPVMTSVFQSPENDRMVGERYAAQQAIYQFFEIENPESLSPETIWTNAETGRLKVVRINGNESIAIMEERINDLEIIPNEIKLGGVKIDQV
jgi:hypothetical protein